VRFHKIRINRYQDKLQGVCKYDCSALLHRLVAQRLVNTKYVVDCLANSSRATRYLVLRRDKSNPQKVEQQTCSGSWTFEKYDQERFAQLAYVRNARGQVDNGGGYLMCPLVFCIGNGLIMPFTSTRHSRQGVLSRLACWGTCSTPSHLPMWSFACSTFKNRTRSSPSRV
jgi:hypothetical protein